MEIKDGQYHTASISINFIVNFMNLSVIVYPDMLPNLILYLIYFVLELFNEFFRLLSVIFNEFFVHLKRSSDVVAQRSC